MIKSRAFTLAEVLVVIGVIGVVSALTLPNLNTSTGNKETITRVKKIYANLNDAFGRARAAHGPLGTWFLDLTVRQSSDRNKLIGGRMAEYLNASKDCGYANISQCWTQKSVNALGNTGGSIGWDCTNSDRTPYAMVLADGSSLLMSYYAYCVKRLDENDNPIKDENGEDILDCTPKYLICVDTDGPNKGPNTWGGDHFVYWFTDEDGVMPGGYDFASRTDGHQEQPCGVDVDTCTAWIVQKGNMDYLKTSDGKTCPNGKLLRWAGAENSTCK